MNDLTYYLLADVRDGHGSPLSGWDSSIYRRRGHDDADNRRLVLARIGTLVEQDLLGVGSYVATQDGGGRWQTWTGTFDDVMTRVAAEYRNEDPEDPAYEEIWNCYLVDTERGNALYDAERARRVGLGIDPMARLDGIWPTADGEDPEIEL